MKIRKAFPSIGKSAQKRVASKMTRMTSSPIVARNNHSWYRGSTPFQRALPPPRNVLGRIENSIWKRGGRLQANSRRRTTALSGHIGGDGRGAEGARGAAPRREWRAERREAHVVAMFGLGAAGPPPAPRTGRRVQSALRRGTIDLAMPPHQSRHGTSAPFRAGVPRSSPGEAAPRPDALPVPERAVGVARAGAGRGGRREDGRARPTPTFHSALAI